jgi:uncharacterized Zn finger protein
MAQFGRTWWGERFLDALEQFTDPGRLGRGQSYASNGRIVEHTLERGTVNAKVRGSVNPYYGVYKEPIYRTTIKITQISAKDWTTVVKRIASRADLVTKLLQQEMPDPIEDVFADEGLHLLPHSQSDFDTDCSCPDWDNPCKHIAGVYYLLARDLDRDPFVLFELRGLSRESLHAELVKSPLGEILASSLQTGEIPVAPVESFHTRPTKVSAGAAVSHREFWAGPRRLVPARTAAAANSSQARVSALLVKKQGDYPPFWHRENSFVEVMEEIYDRVRTKSPQMK